MKKEIRKVDEKTGIVQITTADERWYVKMIENKEGIPEVKFVPSVTWIASYYPKGLPFYKWLANKGWDEAEAIKQAAGDKGSKVHQAIEDLVKGNEVKMDAKYLNKTTEKEEELTVEEYECIMSFASWFNRVKPVVLASEQVVFNDAEGYAGTVDMTCEIDGRPYILDFKTGQTIWPEHELQISAYKHALPKDILELPGLATLQLGYRRNKDRFKFTEIEDKYDLFLTAKKIWANETKGIEPLQKDYPPSLRLDVKAKVQKPKKK